MKKKDQLKESHIIKPHMRIYAVENIRNQGGTDQTLKIFFKTFADKKTGLIKIAKLISAMKALGYFSLQGYHRHIDLVEKMLSAYTTKPPGFITTQNLLKILERQYRYQPRNLTNDQVEEIFLSFAKNGKLGIAELQKVQLELGIRSNAQQRKKMIKCFARNGSTLDKYDFVQLINGAVE